MNMHAMNMQRWLWGGGLDVAYCLTAAARRPLLMTTGTRVWTLNPSIINESNILKVLSLCDDKGEL